MAFIQNCKDCNFYTRQSRYCQRKARQVMTTGEAVICEYYTPIGQVAISDLGLLGGFLVGTQIPSGIINTEKIADAAIKTTKIDNSAITNEKIANQAVTGDKICDGTVLRVDLEDFIVTNQKVANDAAVAEGKLSLNYPTSDLNTAILLRELLANKDAANGYLGLDAGAKVPLAKLNPLTNTEIAAAAAIVESKLSLAYGTSALNTAILLRELASNKDIANGYLGLDAGAKVPLAKLNPLLDAQIAAAAGIVESKLALTYGTQALHDDIATRLLAATYAAHDHSLTDPTQVDHANLTNVLTDQHHPQIHNLSTHGDVAATGAQLEALLMFGVANAAWQPCIFEVDNSVSGGIGFVTGAGLTNFDAIGPYLRFILPLPCDKGTLALFVSGVRVSVSDADATNYVDHIKVNKVRHNAQITIYPYTGNITSVSRTELPFAATTCTAYSAVEVELKIVAPNTQALDIKAVEVRCFYA